MRKHFIFSLIAIYINTVSCAYLRPTSSTLKHAYIHKKPVSKTLIVILPGIDDNLDDFVKNGVVDGLIGCRPDADIIYVDAHYGYYQKNILVKRLRQDVIKPANLSGIKNIWLFGVSLGGYGSLKYREVFPDDIKGLILIAPFLGLNHDFNLFKKQSNKRYYLPEFYNFLSKLEVSAKHAPHIQMAYGSEDAYHKQHQWMAALLEPHQSFSKPGVHNWPTWNKLWPTSLTNSRLCSNAASTRH